eukprot:Hpha_TRINITY_DN15813_c1_g4::TRINITY_DN15813_c1_g4_i1::g.189344::m.189344
MSVQRTYLQPVPALPPVSSSSSDCNASAVDDGTDAFIDTDNLIGVMIEVVAACICIIGMNGMKAARETYVAQERERNGESGEQCTGIEGGTSTLMRRQRAPQCCETQLCFVPWLAALAVYGIGQGMQVLALGYGDASVIQSVSMLALVLNVYIAKFYFKEQVPNIALMSTGLVIFGAAMASLGGISPPCLDLHVFDQHISEPASIVAVCTLICIVCIMALILGGFGNTKLVRNNDSLFHALLASALGSLSFFSGNIFSKLGRATIREGTGFTSFGVCGAVFACVALCELTVLNRGLSHCESVVFIPTYYVLVALFLMIANTAFFSHEAADQYRARPYKIPIFVIGVIFVIIGVYFLGQVEAAHVARDKAADCLEEDDETEGAAPKMMSPGADGPVHYAALPPQSDSRGESEQSSR